jgi:diguanylate cyclase (GGDEF)-like protein
MDAPAPRSEFDTAIERARALFAVAPREAVAHAQEALRLARSGTEGGAARQQALGHWALGLARSCAGEHVQGLGELQLALDLVPPDATSLRCRVLRGLSIAHELLGGIEAMLDWALQALEAARAEGDPQLLSDALLTAGVARSRSGDNEGGLLHFLEALALIEDAGDREAQISVLNNIGINNKNLGRHEDAVRHLENAMALARELNQDTMAAVAASNLGEPLWRLGRLDEARQVLRGAVGALGTGGFTTGETHARTMLGQVLLACGDAVGAHDELVQALSIASRTGSLNHVARAHLALSGLHKAQGRHAQALHHHEEFHAAERRQYNEESARQVHALHVVHDLAQARSEAQTHRLRHAEAVRAHDELKALHAALQDADREKTRLLTQLEALSRSDALTGLANRRWLDERLAQEFDRARRQQGELAVAMCDLDNFKRINDQLGHAMGDAVLRGVAEQLRRHCRSIDVVARYGGEEFCIVFVDADGATAQRACESLRAAVQAFDWRALHAQLVVTISIGISEGLTLASHEALLAAADTQLYEAKRQGKNRVCRALAT